MCLAVPARVIKIKDAVATVDISGVQRDVSTMLLPDIHPEEYVLVHAGFAMQRINAEDAEERNSLLNEMHGGMRTIDDTMMDLPSKHGKPSEYGEV